MEVEHAYIALFHDKYPHLPTSKAVAKLAKVGHHTYASLVIKELLGTGTIIDPEITK
jgi:hypothetical protein